MNCNSVIIPRGAENTGIYIAIIKMIYYYY